MRNIVNLLTIKAKLIVMGVSVVCALAALAGISEYSSGKVRSITSTNAALIEQLNVAEQLKYSASKLVLDAMDIRATPSGRKVDKTTLEEVEALSELLQEALGVVQAWTGLPEEGKAAVEVLGSELPLLITTVKTDLVQLMSSSAERLSATDSEFSELANVVNSQGFAAGSRLKMLEQAFLSRREKLSDSGAIVRMSKGVELTLAMDVELTQLRLAALDALNNRALGMVSGSNMGIIDETTMFLRDNIDALRGHCETADELKNLGELKENVLQLSKAVGQKLMQVLRRSSGAQSAIRNEFFANRKAIDNAYVQVNQNLGILTDAARKAVTESSEALLGTVVNASLFGLCVFGGVTVLAVIGLLLFMRSLLRPINATVTYAGAVAAGDFDSVLPVSGTDEMGRLGESLRVMVDKLKEMIAMADAKGLEAERETAKAQSAMEEAAQARRLADAATREGIQHAAANIEGVVERVTSAAAQLAAQAEQINQGTAVQSDRITATATSMEQMTSTVLEVARNAGEAAGNAAKTKDEAQRGAALVSQLGNSIDELGAHAATMKTGLGQLGEQAEAIGHVMSVINDIADQTNLLALNAAIEAARAGDAGRGFAVVADEVRKLAEKTMGATKEVGDKIHAIQNVTMQNIKDMNVVADTVAASLAVSGRSAEALRGIVDFAEANAGQAQSIATASEEQSSAMEEINAAIEEVNRISTETAEGMSQSARAIAELAAMAEELRGVVEGLKQ